MPADCQGPQKRRRDADVERPTLPRCACPVGGGLRQQSPYDKWAVGCSTDEFADKVPATFQPPSPRASKQWHRHAVRPVAVHAKYHAGREPQAQRDCSHRSTQYPGRAARHDAETHHRESVRERQTARTHSAPCDSDPCQSTLAPRGGSTPADTVRLLLPASRGEDHGPMIRRVSTLPGAPHNRGSVWPHANPAVGTSVPPTWPVGFSLYHPG